MATRMQIARHIAHGLSGDRQKAITEAAVWLSAKGKARQASYLAKDVAWVLEQEGYVFARVTVAKPLTAATEAEITAYIKKSSNAREVELEVLVDQSVIGGVRIDTPSSTLDETVKSRLQALIREVEA